MVCRGLDMNLSGKVAKKTTLTRKRGRPPRPQRVPSSYRCVRNLSPNTAKAAATEYTHINVAVVTHSHFGNAKPKFHMNCWPTISISDRSCRQCCITEARKHFNVHIFIYIHYIQKYWQTAEDYIPVQLSLCAVKHKTKLYLELSIFFCAGTMTSSVNARANQNVNNIWLADVTYPSRRTTFPRCKHVTFLISPGAFRKELKNVANIILKKRF